MYKRLFYKPFLGKQSFFLFGARGTGKSFWINEICKKHILIDLLKTDLFYKLEAHPETLESYIPEGYKNWIVIDEVQKIPILLDEVHRLIERKKYKFILTGSSARKLKRQGVNLLAGRALTYKMFPLTVKELGEDFNLQHSVLYGNLPQTYSLSKTNPKGYLKSYIQTYLKEEVRQEGFARDLGSFSRFLEVASFSQGSILNMSEIGRESEIKQKTIEGYFDLLEDMLIAYRLPVFTKRAKRQMVSHPKFYFFDTGVYRTLRPKGILDVTEELEGAALETLVLQEIIALNEYLDLGYEIFYWRTKNGLEVDFILYNEKKLIGIEIKRSKKIHRQNLNGLKAFKDEYSIAQNFIFYGGDEELYFNDIKAIPIVKALKNLSKILSS